MQTNLKKAPQGVKLPAKVVTFAAADVPFIAPPPPPPAVIAPIITPPPVEPPSIDADLDEAMNAAVVPVAEENHVHSSSCVVCSAPVPEDCVLVTFVATAGGAVGKGKKNTRFGRNADGTVAKKADKKEYEHKSDWGKFLADFKKTHPGMLPQDATMEAQMRYVPKNNKKKSYERIFCEVWKRYTPQHVQMSKEEKILAMREDFIRTIPIGLRSKSK